MNINEIYIQIAETENDSSLVELAKSEVLNVKSAKLGSAVQTLPLHRLERQAELSIGICSEEDISE